MEYLFWLEAGRVEFRILRSINELMVAARKGSEYWNYAPNDDWDWYRKYPDSENFLEVEVEEVPREIRAVLLILR